MNPPPSPIIKDRPVIKPLHFVIEQVALLTLLLTAFVGCFLVMLTPHFSFGLVERLVCPRGAEIRFETGGLIEDVDADGNSTTTRQFFIRCYAPDGTMYKRTIPALAAALGGFYIVAFFPLLVITLIRRAVRKTRIKRAEPPPPIPPV